jgi:hypothetical protein
MPLLPAAARWGTPASGDTAYFARGARIGPIGYTPGMDTLDENLVRDTICGLELQLIDAVERQERAEIQDDQPGADRIQVEIDTLQTRLAAVAEVVATLD